LYREKSGNPGNGVKFGAKKVVDSLVVSSGWPAAGSLQPGIPVESSCPRVPRWAGWAAQGRLAWRPRWRGARGQSAVVEKIELSRVCMKHFKKISIFWKTDRHFGCRNFATFCRKQKNGSVFGVRVNQGSMLWSQFSAKKLAFFLNTNVMINFFQKLALFWVKNANFFAKIFGENI
jgi:hypothetical protein